MKATIITTLVFTILGMPVFADSHTTGDSVIGENLFKKCKACHSIANAEGKILRKGGKVGPNLYGILGRDAGTEENFSEKYGASILEAGKQGLGSGLITRI